jgi:hypothetical protein
MNELEAANREGHRKISGMDVPFFVREKTEAQVRAKKEIRSLNLRASQEGFLLERTYKH